jgi:serine/threonine protein kinase
MIRAMGTEDQRAPAGISEMLRGAAKRGDKRDVEGRRLRGDVKAHLFGKATEPVKVGRFRLQERLGAGGMGQVYAAIDTHSDRKVALKIIESDDGQGRARIQREARVMSELSHPNVGVVYEVGAFEEGMYLAMEFISGVTLRQWLETPRGWDEVLAALLQAADALAAAHGVRVIHRDFKPDNVMIDEDGHVSLLDFGLAKPMPEATSVELALSTMKTALTRPGARLGTPGYMAPEQVLGKTVDARADVFAFCVTAYEALFGRFPFAGDSPERVVLSVLRGEVTPPPEHTEVPETVREAVLRGLSKDPEDRPGSMAEVVQGLLARPERALVATRAPDRGDAEPGILALLGRLVLVLLKRLVGRR